MAWIYLAEPDSPHKVWHHGSAQSPIVKETKNAFISFSAECLEEKSKVLHCARTLPLFAEEICEVRLTSSPQDSLARISALPDAGKAWAAAKVSFSGMWSALPKKQRLRLFFSKTCGQEYESTFRLSEVRLRDWAMNAEMECSKRMRSEQDIKELAGSWLPTPTANQRSGFNWGGGSGRKGPKRYSLEALWKMGKIPTLTARLSRSSGVKSGMASHSPSVSDYWKATTGMNMPPSFCEWIMGVHIGATASEPLALAWYRSSQKQHLKYLRAANRKEKADK